MTVDELIAQVLQGQEPDTLLQKMTTVSPPIPAPPQPQGVGDQDPRALSYDGSRNFGPAQKEGPKVVR